MMPAMLVLESFDRNDFGEPGAELSGADLQELRDLPEMDAAPIRPPRAIDDDLPGGDDSALDPETMLREELEAERAALRGATAAIIEQTSELQAAVTRQAADAVALVAGEVLPALVDEGFTSELAAAIVGIVEAGGNGQFNLELAPGDHDAVIEGLRVHMPPLPVTVSSEPERTAGRARLNWHAGGAEFDIAEMIDRGRQLLSNRISAISQGKTNDE